MLCSKCGATLPALSRFCSGCGQEIGDSRSGMMEPAPDAPTSGKALASMITGIFGLLCFPIAIAAIILGHISRSEIRKSNGQLKGLGMSTAGLVMGYGAFALIPFVLIIAAIAIPNLLRARMAANEASAVASVRNVNVAEIAYREAYPSVGFACTLESLGGSGMARSAEHSQLIDDLLARGQKNGYRFAVENCVNTETEHKYQVVAHPQTAHQSGTRTFCSDESGVIKAGEGETAEQCLSTGAALE